MRVRDAADLAIKLFGIYFLFDAMTNLIYVFNPYIQRYADMDIGAWFDLLATPGVMLIGGLAFLYRTDLVVRLIWRNKEHADLPRVRRSLGFWLVFVGIYYFFWSLSSFGYEVYIGLGLGGQPVGGATWTERHLSGIIVLAVSILFVVKAPAIANLIVRLQRKSSGLDAVPPAQSPADADKV